MGDQLLENNILKSLQKMIRLIRIPRFDKNSMELFYDNNDIKTYELFFGNCNQIQTNIFETFLKRM